MMDYKRLDYIKNVTDQGNETERAYPEYPIGAYFRLNFKRRESTRVVESHAHKLPKGSLIILSQVPHKCKNDITGEQKKIPDGCNKRYLTHVVELVNEGSEDEPQWVNDRWGIFRWVKVHWIADLRNWNSIPVDKEVMRAEWGCYNTCAKSLSKVQLLKKQWKDDEHDEQWMNKLREHLIEKLNLEAVN
ncbi:MAG: hypothetical protein V7L31_11735 [Nostoc sp.]|uniref:hypothetical protein n=1 Tax=Nostoc sp. TaxID=1180 RepID=UPI002FF23B8A